MAAALPFASATELARMIRDGETTSVELTQLYLDRIARSELRAVVVLDADRALADARAADATAPTGPLHGVPVTVKESFDVAGLPTTWGLPARRDHRAERDADVVARLRAAGAIVLGKTNVPPMLGDFQAANEIYGRTLNPWDPTRVPGGSSGGSAAALAAGLSALDVGSDLGGSVRVPAHCCGVFAHKPTFGAVSFDGHHIPGIPLQPDMAVIGPLARSADDLALALDVITARPLARARHGRLRVAVWPTDPVTPVEPAIADRVVSVAEALARAGAILSEARPAFDVAAYRRTYVSLTKPLMGMPVEPDELAASSQERTRLRSVWADFFRDHDVVLCPAMAFPAPAHDDTRGVFTQVLWSALATLAYLPATVAPTGASPLPIGVQLIGAEGDDHTTIAAARLVGGFTPPPGSA